MKLRAALFLVIIGSQISCQYNSVNEKARLEFKIPEIVNSQFTDSIKSIPFKAEFVSEVFPAFAGKYKFQNKIDINPKIVDSTIFNDFLEEYSQIRLGDSIDANGFELIVDYENTIKYNRYYNYDSTLNDHYPVYFVNSTNTDKIFLAKDSYAFGIQEAIDTTRWPAWKPIESRGFDFCGNGCWGLIVHPGEFVLVLMRKYEGEFKTGIRVRFEVGDNIYVSKPFKGRIDQNQFNIQDSSYFESQLKKTNGKAAFWLFYGATLDEEVWAVKTF